MITFNLVSSSEFKNAMELWKSSELIDPEHISVKDEVCQALETTLETNQRLVGCSVEDINDGMKITIKYLQRGNIEGKYYKQKHDIVTFIKSSGDRKSTRLNSSH